MSYRLKPLVVICLALFIAGGARAEFLTWTFSGAAFDDGGTASGSFDYDADTNTYSSIDIVTTGGSLFGGATYTFLDAGSTYNDLMQLDVVSSNSADLTGTPLFTLLTGGLTDAGHTVGILIIGEGWCSDSTCAAGALVRRSNPDVSVIGTISSVSPAPEPASALLGCLGALLIGISRLKRPVKIAGQ